MTTQTWPTLLNDLRAHRAKFSTVIAFINQHYAYAPQAFSNGVARNAAGQNEGACRVFAFAQLIGLSEQDTLLCFAEHYASVIATPNADDHANIRAFMISGWHGVRFEMPALTKKS
ncbi:MAG: HopJ type III effector protein [Paraperlucidibaca sp.]